MRTANMSGPLVQLGGVTYVNMVSFSSLPFSSHSPQLPCFLTCPLASSHVPSLPHPSPASYPIPSLHAHASLPDLRWPRRIQRTGGAQRRAPRPPTESQHAHNRARPDRHQGARGAHAASRNCCCRGCTLCFWRRFLSFRVRFLRFRRRLFSFRRCIRRQEGP